MITAEEMRPRLGLDPADESADALIEAILRDAEGYARAFCRLRAEEDVPAYLLRQMAAEDYGRMDGAGLASRSVSGVTEHYRGGYSDGVMRQLCAMRHPGGEGSR